MSPVNTKELNLSCKQTSIDLLAIKKKKGQIKQANLKQLSYLEPNNKYNRDFNKRMNTQWLSVSITKYNEVWWQRSTAHGCLRYMFADVAKENNPEVLMGSYSRASDDRWPYQLVPARSAGKSSKRSMQWVLLPLNIMSKKFKVQLADKSSCLLPSFHTHTHTHTWKDTTSAL